MSNKLTLVNMSSIYEDGSYLKKMDDSEFGRVCRALIKEENKRKKDREEREKARKEPFEYLNLYLGRTYTPNIAVRSHLYLNLTSQRRNTCGVWENVEVFSTSNKSVEIWINGELLSPVDFKYWCAMIKIAHSQHEDGEGYIARFSLYELLGVLQKSRGKKEYAQAEESLERLSTTTIKVVYLNQAQGTNHKFQGSIIKGLVKDENSKQYICELSECLAHMLNADSHTYFPLEKLKLLARNEWAQLFYIHLMTHSLPFNFTWAQLFRISGKNYNSLSGFKKNFKRRVLATLIKKRLVDVVVSKNKCTFYDYGKGPFLNKWGVS